MRGIPQPHGVSCKRATCGLPSWAAAQDTPAQVASGRDVRVCKASGVGVLGKHACCCHVFVLGGCRRRSSVRTFTRWSAATRRRCTTVPSASNFWWIRVTPSKCCPDCTNWRRLAMCTEMLLCPVRAYCADSAMLSECCMASPNLLSSLSLLFDAVLPFVAWVPLFRLRTSSSTGHKLSSSSC